MSPPSTYSCYPPLPLWIPSLYILSTHHKAYSGFLNSQWLTAFFQYPRAYLTRNNYLKFITDFLNLWSVLLCFCMYVRLGLVFLNRLDFQGVWLTFPCIHISINQWAPTKWSYGKRLQDARPTPPHPPKKALLYPAPRNKEIKKQSKIKDTIWKLDEH